MFLVSGDFSRNKNPARNTPHGSPNWVYPTISDRLYMNKSNHSGIRSDGFRPGVMWPYHSGKPITPHYPPVCITSACFSLVGPIFENRLELLGSPSAIARTWRQPMDMLESDLFLFSGSAFRQLALGDNRELNRENRDPLYQPPARPTSHYVTSYTIWLCFVWSLKD